MGLMIGWPCSQHSDNILIIEKPKVITPTNGPRSVSIDRDPVPLQAQAGPMKPPIIAPAPSPAPPLQSPRPSLFFLHLTVRYWVCWMVRQARQGGLWALLLSKKFITRPDIFAEEWLFPSSFNRLSPPVSLFFYLSGRSVKNQALTGLISPLAAHKRDF